MPSSPCAHKPSALRAAVCWYRRSLPSAHHPPASRATSVGSLQAICPPAHRAMPAGSPQTTCQRTAQHLVAPCKPSANATCTTIRRPLAQHPPSHRKPSAIALRTLWPPAQHPSSHGAASADPCAPSSDSLQAIRWREAMPLTACTSEPSSRTDTLSPCKNTLCTIVNCPLQIKPVFYFLFTSTAPPAHRIRVKLSLLRLGRFCLALPFTHLGKDIT